MRDGAEAAVEQLEHEVRALHADLRARMGREPHESQGSDPEGAPR